MKTGASTSCLFPMLTEQSLEHLLKLGVKNIEAFLASPSERGVGYARMLKNMADAEGAKIVSVHPYSSEIIPKSLPAINEANKPAIAITKIGINLITVDETWNFAAIIGDK